MKVPAKGKAVMYKKSNGATCINYSLGVTSEYAPGCIKVSEYSDGSGKIECLEPDNWQEVEIVPVIHVPEDMKLCKVWNDTAHKIPQFRLSAGRLDLENRLLCYMEGTEKEHEPLSPWKHWEEAE